MFLPSGMLLITCVGLYAGNILTHFFFISKRNPTRRPSEQAALQIFRFFSCVPILIFVGSWLLLWIFFWQLLGRPLWKPPKYHSFNGPMLASVSMCGGGFRTWYHLGVYWGLFDRLGVCGIKKIRFSGASVGALVAAVAACGVHPADIWAHIPAIAKAFRSNIIGHISEVGQFCRYLLHSTLPEDAHLRATDRLFLSISSIFPYPRNLLQSHFNSRNDLIDAIIAAQFIPFWTHPGLCLYGGNVCVDGGVTNNLPILGNDSLCVGLDNEDIEALGADLVPSEPLARVNTFIPANEDRLLRMLTCGKNDINVWLKSPKGRIFFKKCSTESIK